MSILDTTKDLSALFIQQALATPDAIALEDDARTLTYAELHQEVDKLAHKIRSHGVGRDSLVGILLSRSADYVIACLAALRAGGAFLVLELAYPPELLADVIKDAEPLVILTHEEHVKRIKADVPLIILDRECIASDKYSAVNGQVANLPPGPSEEDLERLAFVSYSSGTTGKPKGIANPHRAAVHSYNLRFGISDLQPSDRVACNVFFVWEILRPVLRGAAVVVVSDAASYDPDALIDLLRSKRVTETLVTPTLLSAILSRHFQLGSMLPDLRKLWLNGEVVTTDLARRAMKTLPQTRLLNCYSASETHEIACGDIRKMLEKNECSFCPVGPPIDPHHMYILNESREKVGEGETGELFVGGHLLARGYLNLPETTAKSFVPDPFSTNASAVMYRTGDLARMLPSGDLEITGRIGSMVKIRGYSIVPGKVENAIIDQLAVSHCIVTAQGEGLERQLVAYIVRDKKDNDARVIPEIDDSGYSPMARRVLASSLAHYMLPAQWVILEELPTHGVSGKIDLKRLHPPPVYRARAAGTLKTAGAELSIESIAKVWAASLNLPMSAVTLEHTFFDLGGHSLSLSRCATNLSSIFGVSIPLGRLAEDPTLTGHLHVVRSIRDGQIAAVQADLPAVLRADSTLPNEIKPSGASICSLSDAKTILLTGATGFLGGFLLSDLLETTSARITCLVRFNHPVEDDVASGMARVRKNLLEMGLWTDSMADRIDILPGNVSQRRFGLTPDHYEELIKGGIQLIVHAAATVNLVYPYGALREANVLGTLEVIRLASEADATLQYVSTNGVLSPSTTGSGWTEDTSIKLEDVPNQLEGGYCQTKWVSEKLVNDAGSLGLPVRIYRVGTICGHSTSGSTNPYDLITALIVESLQLGFCPAIEGWRIEMAPVDYVSKGILAISNDVQTAQRIFHLGDSDPIEAVTLFESLNNLGYPTKPLPWEEWVELWNQKRGSINGGFTIDILRGGMPTLDSLKNIVVLDDAVTKRMLEALPRPKIDDKLLEIYARHWFARGWLPRPPSRHHTLGNYSSQKSSGPLFGRVVVVTGASSGIGAAVAAAAAAEGAHVALAARRIEAMEELKRKLMLNGGKVLIHKTDVTDRSQVESLMRAVNDKLGAIDVLVACAGVMYWTMMGNARTEEWEHTIDVNCKGFLHCLSSTVPAMLSRGSGHIVAISSDAGRKVFPGLGVYSASKFFVEATLQSLRLETAGTGLRVTSVQPGNTATELLGMSTDEEAIKKYGQPSGAKILDPEDVASAIIYALKQPAHVAVNEVLIEPRDEPI
jgi:amino acid adenylation domain-containing protein/thioester reductase-like protein